MSKIAENLQHLKQTVPDNVKIVAVSKTKPTQAILEAYQTGHRAFGENKVQELAQKYEELPKDIEWHFIGHLQTNKIKYIANFVSLVHGVDSFKVLKVIDKEAKKHNRVINCLLQFHIAEEETKYGLSKHEAFEMLKSDAFNELRNVSIQGVMGMATYTDDQLQIRKEFASLKTIFDEIKANFFANNSNFNIISMGMSGDYITAIEEKSNLIRVGTAIFGDR